MPYISRTLDCSPRMAAITGCLLYKNPRFFLDEKSSYLAVSSFSASKFHGFSLAQRVCFPAARIPRRFSVVARIGGYRPPGESRRFREYDDEFDSAMDLSSIRSSTVRLIDAQQNMVGVVPKGEAIQMAEDAGLDLVVLSPDADPPVLRIMDYKKYRYEQQKKKRGQQKKSAAIRMNMKELKMGYNIDSHDYSVRLKAAQRFLKDGDKVKVIVNLKGRENEFRNIAIELIKRFQNDIGELATEENKSFTERNIYIILLPNRTIQQKSQEQTKKESSAAGVSANI